MVCEALDDISTTLLQLLMLPEDLLGTTYWLSFCSFNTKVVSIPDLCIYNFSQLIYIYLFVFPFKFYLIKKKPSQFHILKDFIKSICLFWYFLIFSLMILSTIRNCIWIPLSPTFFLSFNGKYFYKEEVLVHLMCYNILRV